MERVLRDLGLGGDAGLNQPSVQAGESRNSAESSPDNLSSSTNSEIAELREQIVQLRKEFEEFRSQLI